MTPVPVRPEADAAPGPRPRDDARDDACAVLQGLAVGLVPGQAGLERLLERVANHAAAEGLRAMLVELGAAALLEGAAGAHQKSRPAAGPPW